MENQNGKLYSVAEVKQRVIEDLRKEGMLIRIPCPEEDSFDYVKDDFDINTSKISGSPDVGAIRKGREVVLVILRDFRNCYSYSDKRMRRHEIAKEMARPEQILFNLRKKHGNGRISVKAQFLMLNCLEEDITSNSIKGIERKIFSPDKKLLLNSEGFVPSEREIPDADYSIKKNRKTFVLKPFVKELSDWGVKSYQITKEDFYEAGLGGFLREYCKDSVLRAMKDIDHHASERYGRGLPKREIERIKDAYERFNGYANQAAKALRHSTCTILRWWKRMHFRIRPCFTNKYSEGRQTG